MPLLAFTGYLGRVDLVGKLRNVLDDERLDLHERALIRAQLGRMLMHAGELEAGSEQVKQAIPDLAGSPFEKAQSMIMLGGPSGLLWPAEEHLRWLERSALVAQASMPETDRLNLLIDRMTALLGLGEESGWELAQRFSEDALADREALVFARASLNIGSSAMRWGRYSEAQDRLTTSADVAGRHRYQRLREFANVTRIHLDWFTGAWDRLADRAAESALLEQEPLIQLDARLVIGLLGLASGGDPAAEESLRQVRAESARRGAMDMSLESAAALARLRLAHGDVEEALALTDEAEQVVAGKGMWLWAGETMPVRVRALVLAGREHEAGELAARFERGLKGRDISSARAALKTCLALLADAQQDPLGAADAWRSAAAAWRQLPRPYEALLAEERYAWCVLRAGDHSSAPVQQLAGIAQALETLGAARDADRVVNRLRKEGVAVGSRRRPGRRGYGDQLSPRELEVVQFLLRGMSNREIAVALSRSPKTVAAQLNSAMRKHGVSSRTALAVVVTQRALSSADPPDAPAGRAPSRS